MTPSSKRRRPSSSRPQPRPPEPSPVAGQDPGGGREPEGHEVATVRRADRLGPAAGMAFAFLATFGLSFLQIGEVDLDDPAATVARRYADSRGQVGLGVLLILLSLFFFLVFIAWLYRWLRDVEGPGGWLAPLAVVSGAVMIATISAVVLVSLAGTVLEDYGADPVIARTLLVLQARAVAIVFPPTAAFLGATSLVGFNRGVLPKWLTYSGLAIALGLLLALLPFFLGALWVGMLAALLLQRGRMGRT